MKRIVISTEKGTKEPEVLPTLLEKGLDYFHIRKPGFSEEAMQSFLDKVPRAALPYCVLHSHHHLALNHDLGGIHFTEQARKNIDNKKEKWAVFEKYAKKGLNISTSLHRMAELHENLWLFDYAFFGPVFPSISKEGHHPRYEWSAVKKALRDSGISTIALGGVRPENVPQISEAGFAGYALKGWVWQTEDPVEAFEKTIKKEPYVSTS